MTRFQALLIKVLRVRWGYSWRDIHIEWQLRYIPKEEWWYNSAIDSEYKQLFNRMHNLPIDAPDGNQVIGMELCSDAIKLLNDDVSDFWN